jgi:DNA-binding NtrC family response regulator
MTSTSATRALIVDHDVRVCRVLYRIFTRIGLECSTAVNFTAFKSLYENKMPAIILLNRDIAGYNYTEFSRYLAECRSRSAIFLVCDMEDDDTRDFIALGRTAGLNIQGTIRKPINMDTVKRTLAETWQEQAAPPVKKNPDAGPGFRLLKHKDNLDPDQQPIHRFCYKFRTKYPFNNRAFPLLPIPQG